MATFKDLSEHVLHDIVAVAIDTTRYRGWQLSLRLVSRNYNEAVLYVFYLQKRRVGSSAVHSVVCLRPCQSFFCKSSTATRRKEVYVARFALQSVLALRKLSGNAHHALILLDRWKGALAILREVENVRQLASHQLQFYSTCSDNPIFNDVPSAILSQAITSYLESYILIRLSQGQCKVEWVKGCQVHPAAFWVALSACVLGDLHLLDLYAGKSEGPPDACIAEQNRMLLKATIWHRQPHLIRHLLDLHPDIISEIRTDYTYLQAGIFSNNNEVLKTVLEHTPNLPDMLTEALSVPQNLLMQSGAPGAETIRSLTRHFKPLSAEAHTWLIIHSCAVGDVKTLVELFSHRADDAHSLIPTYVDIAIRCGHVNILRFLLDQGILKSQSEWELTWLMDYALLHNQTDCYRELQWRYDVPAAARRFEHLSMADNAEALMANFIREHKDLLFQTRGKPEDPVAPSAEMALGNAIQRLKPGNVRFLLDQGVRRATASWKVSNDPVEVQWPYFNQNRDAFQRIQALLDAFGLPKISVVV